MFATGFVSCYSRGLHFQKLYTLNSGMLCYHNVVIMSENEGKFSLFPNHLCIASFMVMVFPLIFALMFLLHTIGKAQHNYY